MISQNTIEAVKNADIKEVIEALSTAVFNKNNKCSCPIHEEKTASLSIHKNGFFKCFGCGIGGDGITFAQTYLNTDFAGAVEAIAKKLYIPIEYTTTDKTGIEETVWKEKKAINLALEYAAYFFATYQPVKPGPFTDYIEYLKKRGISEETANAFKIGYAPKEGIILDPKFSLELFLKAGLLREKDGQTFPYFYNRVMFPYFDIRGNIIAFTGRDCFTDSKIKYINSPESVWDKSQNLYGLFQSKNRIKETGAVYIVEGQFDCLALYQNNMPAVAASGWAISEAQLAALKKAGAKVITFCPDNDAAGVKSLPINAQKAIAAGFIAKVLFTPNGFKDPAEFLHGAINTDSVNWFAGETDYLEYFAGQAAGIAESGGAADMAEQTAAMISIIETIPDNLLREAYLDKCKKIYKGLRTYKIKKRVEDANLPLEARGAGETPEKGKHGAEYLEFSFFQKGNTLWTFDKKNEVLISNFIIDPLYFIENEEGSQYVCKFTNANGLVKTRTMKAADLTTKNAFTTFAAQLGNFIFVGNDTHLGHIKMKILEGVPAASIPKYLGWNTSFKCFVWANAIYIPSIDKSFFPDRWGIIKTPLKIKTQKQLDRIPSESELLINGQPLTITNIEDWKNKNNDWESLLNNGELYFNKYYYLPSANQIGDNSTETNIQKFKYIKDGKGLGFEDWAALLAQCYKESNNYIPMIGWFLGACFRDLIHKEYNWYPLLNMFGAPGKGKSTAARSLARMFGDMEKDGINIESGSSETGLLRFIATFQNAVIWVNEYKNSISHKKIGVLKSIADGGGKLIGMNTGGTETKTHSTKSAAILSGQDMPTIDPALKSRCITLEFAGAEFNQQAYKELTRWENTLSGGDIINGLMKFRKAFETDFKSHEISVSKELETAAGKAGVKIDDRLLLNNTLIYTPIKLLLEIGVQFPFTWGDVIERAVQSFKMETEIATSTNDIETFFNVLSSCKNIEEGLHYQITKKNGQTLLYLRLNQVSGHYREAASRQGINALDISTLKAYCIRHNSFIEYKAKNVRFDRLPSQTSAYIFDYDKLRAAGIDLYSNFDVDNLL